MRPTVASDSGHERVRQRRAVDGRWDALTVSLVDVAARDWSPLVSGAAVSPDPFVLRAPSWDAAVTGFRDLDPLASLSAGLVPGVLDFWGDAA